MKKEKVTFEIYSEPYLLNSCDLCLAWLTVGASLITHTKGKDMLLLGTLVMMAKKTIPLNNEVNLHLEFKKTQHLVFEPVSKAKFRFTLLKFYYL